MARPGRDRLLALLLAAPAALPLSLAPGRAAAEPVAATYTVVVAGLTVMEVQATLDLDDRGYRMEFRSRPRGVASVMGGGESVTRVEGVWQGDRARPVRYASEGSWRGEPRRLVIEYPNGEPVIRVAVPANEEERQPVPEADRRQTVDNLSAVAQLIRQARASGRCDGQARVFDGRRLTAMSASTGGRDRFAPARNEWSGEALRCAFEGRYLAGFRKDEDVEAARRPQTGQAWLGPAATGGPVIPVRIEAASRWFGTVTVRLESFGPPGGAQARAGR